jgi:hypothetical protein
MINEWINFVPSSETIIVLCADRTPSDVVLTGIGKLGFT